MPGEVMSFYLGWRDDIVAKFKSAVRRNNVLNIANVTFRIMAVADIDPFPPGKQFKVWGPAIAAASGKKLGIESSYTYTGTGEIDTFKGIIEGNLVSKYNAVYGKPYEGRLAIEINRPRDVVLHWSEKISVRGVIGLFRLDCSDELLTFAHAVGLGSKNSIGFGCLMPV